MSKQTAHFISPGRRLESVRERNPLVHNITNFVAMNSTANILLAMGASPVMAHAPQEAADMTALADALVLNIGTLEESWVDSMLLAGIAANGKSIPVVLDPVGAGATRYRTETAHRLCERLRIGVIRGNYSEILALAGVHGAGARGVDSRAGIEERSASEAVLRAAANLGCVVGVSGPIDLISDGRSLAIVRNGHPMMPRITALGCGLSAVVGAWCAGTDPDDSRALFEATAAAFAYYGFAGEIAARNSSGPGAFFPAFLDALYNLTPGQLDEGRRIELRPG